MSSASKLGKAAQFYVDLGWMIFPVWARSKQPVTSNGYKDALANADHWAGSPDANIGLACGLSGLVALDYDPAKANEEGQELADRLLADESIPAQTTPTGGYHFLFGLPIGVQLSNSTGSLPAGWDVRVNGYILLAPSIVVYRGDEAKAKQVEDGYEGRYEWLENRWPHQCPPPPMPDDVLAMLKAKKERQASSQPIPQNGTSARATAYAQAALRNELSVLALTGEGGRNDQLNISAYSLGQLVGGGQLDEWTVRTSLETAAKAIGLEEREARRTIESGISSGKQEPRTAPELPSLLYHGSNGTSPQDSDPDAPTAPPTAVYQPHATDMGNARRMYSQVKGSVFYVPEFGRWYIWADTHWREDNDFEIVRLAKQTVVTMYKEAAEISDDDKRKAAIGWAIRSEGRQRIDAMIDLLRSEPGIAINPDKLDRHPLLVACTNGTLDLRSGDLVTPEPNHYLTKCLPVAYDPAAECPTWIKFLSRIMDGNLDMVAFIQRLVGHALTGDATGKYLVFLWGPKGNNGKSTLVETIMRLLGPYAMKSPVEMVMAKSYRGGIPNDVARLRGVRFTVTNEVDEGMSLSESVVKDLTGNDTLTARFMRAEFFDFTPTHKLWIYGNFKPEIGGTDGAIWDRVKLIEFKVEIPKAERDPAMPERLAAELPGILAWAVRGNLLWQKMGINPPAAVSTATDEYRQEQDTVGEFLKECCEFGETMEISASRIYQIYEAWCKQLGVKQMDGKFFGRELSKRGFDVKHTRLGNMRMKVQLNQYGQSFGPSPRPHWSDER